MKRELYEVTATYPLQDSEFASPEYKARQNASIKVFATGHEQHVWTHTVLLGVSVVGAMRLQQFCDAHQGADIRLAVPNTPQLDGWNQSDEVKTAYRIVVGHIHNENGHIIPTKATTEHGARVVLGRELAKYAGEGWGRIEVDRYGDGRWDRDGVRGKGE